MREYRISEVAPAWVRSRQADNYRARGVESYARGLTLFVRAANDPPIGRVVRADVVRYKLDQAARGLSAGTVRNRLTVLRTFFGWAVEEGYRADNPALGVPYPVVEPPDPDPLSRGQVARLLAVCAQPQRCRASLATRNTRAVALMLYAGLRLAEVAGLRRRDVDLERRTIVVRREVAKGGRGRLVPIADPLAALLAAQPSGAPDWPVIGQADEGERAARPLSAKSLAHIFERWLPAEGLQIHAHQLRKTFATELHLSGVDLVTIQRLLGHADPKTTMRYLGAAGERERAAIAQLRYQ